MVTLRVRREVPPIMRPRGELTMKRLVCVLIAFALASVSGTLRGADGDATSRILGAALTQDRGYETLAWLTDHIGPRLSGSAGLEKAVQWVAGELEREGLERVHTEKILVPHWVRGVESAR